MPETINVCTQAGAIQAVAASLHIYRAMVKISKVAPRHHASMFVGEVKLCDDKVSVCLSVVYFVQPGSCCIVQYIGG
jgi:hypothetical protein